jgi:hypothetical protein
VLAAVASGNTTRGGIAGYLGRKSGDLAHPLTVLQDAGLLVREADAFRDNRSTYRISEPLVTFYEAVMRAVWGQLERPGAGERVWREAGERFRAQVLGPHFERLCREWAATGDAWDPHLVARVAHGVVNDPSRRTTHEVDLAVVGVPDPGRRPPLLAIGEAKLGQVMGVGHLTRLERIREIVGRGERYDTAITGFVLCSGSGFDRELVREASGRSDVRARDHRRPLRLTSPCRAARALRASAMPPSRRARCHVHCRHRREPGTPDAARHRSRGR